jgi:Zn finger protein HypA/HybF involved in hydrogenase expression
MEIRAVPAVWECSSCGRPFARGETLQCPVCRSRARLASGDEIILEQIEMEVADV